MDIEKIKESAEQLIRIGRRNEAREVLLKLKPSQVSRAQSVSVANLARRAGLIEFGLKLMSPIIRPKIQIEAEASPEEKAAYSLLLLGIGASTEALELLESSDQNSPEVLLASAFSHITKWNYVAAAKLLEKYLSSDLPEYQVAVAQVNLAASYVTSAQLEKATELLGRLLEKTSERGWTLLRKNSLELSAQVAIQRQDWAAADQLLVQATNDPTAGIYLDDLFVEKWKAIAEVLKRPNTPDSIARLSKIRSDAIASKHWETVRDCDYHQALARRDQALLNKVFYGSPHQRFRDRVETSAKSWASIPDTYVWQLQEKPSSRIFDLYLASESGGESDGEATLKPGKSLHLALATLSSDFYRPFLIGSLHNAVFRGEYFNPDTSPNRIAFLLHRLREWLKENKIPVQIVTNKAGYMLTSNQPYAFCIRRPSEKTAASKAASEMQHYHVMLEKVSLDPNAATFSAIEVSKTLDISERSARSFLSWALESHLVEKIGSGPRTRYRLIKRQES